MATESPNVEMTEEDAETRSLNNLSSENESDIGENQQLLEDWLQELTALDESAQIPERLSDLGDFLALAKGLEDPIIPLEEFLSIVNPTNSSILIDENAMRSVRSLCGHHSGVERFIYERLQCYIYIEEYPRDEITVAWKPETLGLGIAGRIERHDMSTADMFKHDSALLEICVDKVHISWIYVHSTNGIILSIINSMRGYTFFSGFNDIGHITPEYPILAHRSPLFSNERIYDQFRAVQRTVVIFPCLRLRNIGTFKKDRLHLQSALKPFLDINRKRGEHEYMYGERTLDEAYYPGLPIENLNQRNEDQVITRHYDAAQTLDQRPILMVSQLWIWRTDNKILSSHASTNERRSPGWEPTYLAQSPEAFMAALIARKIFVFGSEETDIAPTVFRPTLSAFESAVSSTLGKVDQYMKTKAFDVEKERAFIHAISDIRSEIAMILEVLLQQKDILEPLMQNEKSEYRQKLLSNEKYNWQETNSWTEAARASKALEDYIKRAGKIDKDAERIEQVIQNKLNLQRTAESIREARQAKTLSLSVFGFTIITFIFTPLSFIATLLALNIDWFDNIKHTPTTTERVATDATDANTTAYMGRKVLGVFIGTEILATLSTLLIGYCVYNLFSRKFADEPYTFHPAPVSAILNRLLFSEDIIRKAEEEKAGKSQLETNDKTNKHTQSADEAQSLAEDREHGSEHTTAGNEREDTKSRTSKGKGKMQRARSNSALQEHNSTSAPPVSPRVTDEPAKTPVGQNTFPSLSDSISKYLRSRGGKGTGGGSAV